MGNKYTMFSVHSSSIWLRKLSPSLCVICTRSCSALSLSDLMLDLNAAGSSRDNERVIELWEFAEANQWHTNNECSRNFLYWFSALGQIQYTLDVISSLIPNVTSSDTLQLLESYKNAKDHTTAQFALQLLVENQFELNREHFEVLLTTSATNGDIPSILHIFNIMDSYNVDPDRRTLDLILQCLETHFAENKYSLHRVNIHEIINQFQRDLLHRFSGLDAAWTEHLTIRFMRWYCQFGDVENAFSFSEEVSFQKQALKSNIMETLAVEQISLLFRGKINLFKAISLLQDILSIPDNSLYALFRSEKQSLLNEQRIVPKANTSRHIFEMLNSIKSTAWCHVNVLNLLLYICSLSGDLHDALYIVHEWYLHHQHDDSVEMNSSSMMRLIEPDHETMSLISKLFSLQSSGKLTVSVQPRTVDWSITIYDWLLTQCQSNDFMLEILSNITMHLLRLLILSDIGNVQHFCDILRKIKSVITDFEVEPRLFAVLGQQTVSDETRLDVVMERAIAVYGFMVETRDGTAKSKMITSVPDRARLLGSMLTQYDRNLCRVYQQIGGSKQSYFTVRRDLQQQFVLKLHRAYSLNDILTLDCLAMTETKERPHTTALDNEVNRHFTS